ncbi:MAG: site-2 protease family protein [Gemmatimonadota bacterium]|nr:site-2 protease family protein [Gemmatimonadota bacterium]
MGAGKPVKLDPAVWLPLLDSYRLTTLPHDTVLEGTLRPGLDGASPEVVEALEAWPAPAYLDHRDGVTHVVLVFEMRSERSGVPWLHAALLAVTLVTTLAAGALMGGRDPFRTRALDLGGFFLPYPSGVQWETLLGGALFALPFLGVLLAHEMGHYVAARAHRVRASLPYVIPFPPYFSIIGTVGAFIRLKGPTVRRSTLFDVGAAGPLVSFVLSIPLLAVGLALSQPVPGDASIGTPFLIRFAGQPVWLGNGLMTHFVASLALPMPLGEAPILLHPLALVGWLGLFVTALNLLPLGQLDGGHVLYAMHPARSAKAARWFLVAMVPLGFVWWGWWAWGGLIAVLHRGKVTHPPVIQRAPEIGKTRFVLGVILILIFFLSFVPVPLRV